MRKLYFSFLLLFCAFVQLQAQNVNVTATAGTTNGSYLTLKDAFDAINAGTHQGAIGINIVASTIETATAQLNASSAPASYTGITITTSSLVSVSASIAGSLINLNGATNISIEGANQLTLANATSGGNVLSFANSAANNSIRNCTIQGITSSVSSGVIFLGAAGLGNGNDNNTFENVIVDGQSLAVNLLFSNGTTTTPTTENSGNIIRNSTFRNVSTTIASPVYIFLSGGNTAWLIQNNSIYQSLPANLTAQGAFSGIIIFPSYTSDAHTVSGNFIGGNAAGATGTMQINGTGALAAGFVGMSIQTGGSGNVIKYNIVRNVSVSYNAAAGTFANAGIFTFIGGYDGTTFIDSNKVDNINITNAGGSAAFYGIHSNGRVTALDTTFQTFALRGDTVSNLVINAGGTGSATIYGMRLETSSGASLTVSSVSNPLFFTQANLITNLSTTFGTAGTIVRGIGTVNTAGASSLAQLWPFGLINSNNINTLSSAGTPASFTNPAVAGILFTGSSNGNNIFDTHDISQNTINNLSSTATADINNTTVGIYLTNSIYQVHRNNIYDLKNKANGATNNPSIIGINARANFDTSFIFNNMISLGNGETTNVQVIGILQNFNAGSPVNTYYNSLYITGTGAGGNNKRSAALLRGTETFGTGITTPYDVVNNILYNVRTGGTGTNYAIANTHSTPVTGWTTDSNDLYSTNPATIANWGGFDNDLAAYMTNASDAGSKSFTVNFVDPINGNLHLTGASIGDPRLEGTPIPGITTDIDGQVRNNDPYIGADEIPTSPLPVEMEFFTGRKQNTVNLLSWKASCTSASITFEIERSTDGRKFNTIGKITASQARCASPFDYTDASPSAGMNYYRLKMIEADGALKYSSIIAILNKTNGFELVGLYPTLVKSKATLSITAAKKTSLQVTVTDANGRKMLQQSMAVADGSALINIELSALANGVYHLTGVTPDGYQKTIRFVKQQ
jgi:hypothetical protein